MAQQGNTQKEFYKVIQKRDKPTGFSKPHLFLRNMAFNILQSFGLGHRPYSLLINLISAFIGLLVIVLLVLQSITSIWLFCFPQ